jgi:uroporphyrinogen decarboxylase
VPEPNTWRDVVASLDAASGVTLSESQVAVQEYGAENNELLQALQRRGAVVTRVPVYRWALPEDVGPLREAITAAADSAEPVLLFTSRTQVDHVARIAQEMGEWERFRAAAARGLVASIGPICTEALLERELTVNVEPEHPRMGQLVQAASQAFGRSGVQVFRQSGSDQSEPAIAPPEHSLWQTSPFMRACRRESTPFTPVWLMRQAGRYMKEYRDLRERVPFLELCKRPDLVSEVTVTAVERIGADAAILFADILLVVEPMGLRLEYTKGDGPVIEPAVRSLADVNRLRELDPSALDYVYQAVRQTRNDLDPATPLIGFAGAPFTIASYLIEGGASRHFEHTKGLMVRDPGAWHTLMDRIARGLVGYLNAQIAAGAGAVQLFDSWVGCLSPADYREFVLPHSRTVIEGITPGVPVIHFGTGTATLLADMRAAGGDVIGLDWRVELDRGWEIVGRDRGVQGNLDPVLLLADPATIRDRANRILAQAGSRPGHIFNLGHGILPQTPVENVIALIDAVHELSSVI